MKDLKSLYKIFLEAKSKGITLKNLKKADPQLEIAYNIFDSTYSNVKYVVGDIKVLDANGKEGLVSDVAKYKSH